MYRSAWSRAVMLAAALFFCVGDAPAQQQAQPPSLRIPRVTVPPKLEDYLDGESTPGGARVAGFIQREPKDGEPASQETTVYLSYDDKNLYAVFVCKDEPGKVRAHLVKREAIFGDDVVGLLLDTYHDRRRAYEFLTNPLGIQLDGIASEGQDDDFSFDTLWHSEGRVTPFGYVVWMAIPFKSLRFTSDDVQTWGVALGRIMPRTNEEVFWPRITRSVAGFAQQMATLEGLEQISPGRNLQIIPYGFFARARFLDDQTGRLRTDTDARAGVDAKIVIKDSFTLDITANPDFSQVESDEPQVTINQRFEVFFPEKRPFFLENAGFFQTPENLFFSRRVADPQFGLRLTGKTGPWALGVLGMDDRAPGRLLDDDPLDGERAAIGVFRVQRELAEQSSVGLLVTSRDFAATSNRVYSVDTRLKLDQNWVFTGQAISSQTRLADGTHLSGPAYFADMTRSGRTFFYFGNYRDRSPDFRSQLGFIPRVDIRQTEHFARYTRFPKQSPVQRFGPSAYAVANWDRRGRLQDWTANVGFSAGFARQTSIFVQHSESFELFRDQQFRKRDVYFEFETEWLDWLAFSASYLRGRGVNFFPARERLPFPADTVNGQMQVTFRPTSRFSFEQTYIYNRLRTPGGLDIDDTPASTSIFNNHLLRSKVNYQFTRELSLRAILDYDAVLPNTDLVELEREKRLNADLLLTYLLNPGTALYVGYTDGYENLRLDPTNSLFRRAGSPTTSVGRQFFVKMSYLLRF
ncbi:MAG TPA: DUF5916 domain-containing protein [Blastocatellia bacterium]|nr:DUF5916 domain-containing protein [Blastocatellia bacterium]